MSTATLRSQVEQIPDEELVELILSGETFLYEQIMRRHNAALYRVGMSIVNNDTEVEDIMQVSYIKAYTNLRTFEGRAGFRTWLTRILINESLQHLKKRKRYMSVEINNDETVPRSNTTDGGDTPVTAVLNKELSRVLEDALARLPEKYRLVFVLREMEERSIAETVGTLEITEANVKVRLNRAKAMLRETLGDYYKHGGVYRFHLVRCDRIVNNVMQHLGITSAI